MKKFLLMFSGFVILVVLVYLFSGQRTSAQGSPPFTKYVGVKVEGVREGNPSVIPVGTEVSLDFTADFGSAGEGTIHTAVWQGGCSISSTSGSPSYEGLAARNNVEVARPGTVKIPFRLEYRAGTREGLETTRYAYFCGAAAPVLSPIPSSVSQPVPKLQIVTIPNCTVGEGCTAGQRLPSLSCQTVNNAPLPANTAIHFAVWPGVSNSTQVQSRQREVQSRIISPRQIWGFYKGGPVGVRSVEINLIDEGTYTLAPDTFKQYISSPKNGQNRFFTVAPFYYECNITKRENNINTKLEEISGGVSANPNVGVHLSSQVTSSTGCSVTSSNDILNGACSRGTSMTISCNGQDGYTRKMWAAVWEGSSNEVEAKKGSVVTFHTESGVATKTGVKAPFYYECQAENNEGKVGKTFKGSVGEISCLQSGDIKGNDGKPTLEDFETWKESFQDPSDGAVGDCNKDAKVDLIDFNIWRDFCLKDTNCLQSLREDVLIEEEEVD